jgi:steroid delta-isomerase-like uncharacterized protein
MSTEENKAITRRWFAELNKGNLAAADEIYAAHYILHDPNNPPDLPPGPEGVKQFLAPFLTAFPDTQGTIEDLVAEGDKVAVRYTIRGTHQGEFQGIAPTGKQVTMTGTGIIRFAGGQMVEEWQNDDVLGLLQQIGAIPAPAG